MLSASTSSMHTDAPGRPPDRSGDFTGRAHSSEPWVDVARPRAPRPGAWRERVIELGLRLNGYVAVILIGLIFAFLFKEGVQALWHIAPGDFLGTTVTDYR